MAQTASAVKPNGFIVYEGPSRHDRKPVVVIATNTVRPSSNPKTGPMVQIWLLRQDVPPATAVKDGSDESVCNDCPYRAVLRRAAKAAGAPDSPACYVRADAAVQNVWRAYARGSYPRLSPKEARRAFAGKAVRGGAYGNMSNVPLWVTRLWAKSARMHTQYDHAWRTAPKGLTAFAMASVGSLREREVAKQLGYRTFRVKQPDEAVAAGERECPAQEKFRAKGIHVTCDTCGTCNGTNGKSGRVDIVIDDHGPTSAIAQAKRRFALTTV